MENADAKRRRLDPPTDVDAFAARGNRPQLHPTPTPPAGLRAGLHPQLHPNLQAAPPATTPVPAPAAGELPSGPRYQTQCVLGRGSFGTVCKAIEVRSRKTVAIKTVEIPTLSAYSEPLKAWTPRRVR